MDNIYPVGSFITAQKDPASRLVIRQYLKRIYYCHAVDDPGQKVLAYYERELIPPTVPVPLL